MERELIFKGIVERVEYSHAKYEKRTIVFLKDNNFGQIIEDEFINLKIGDKVKYSSLSGFVRSEWKFRFELIVNGIKILVKDK